MHTVIYENAPSGWNEALPLGNGHFGGMMFFEDNKLTLAMNHYEVYYRKLHRYSQAYRCGERRPYRKMYGRTYEELKVRAREMYRDPGRSRSSSMAMRCRMIICIAATASRPAACLIIRRGDRAVPIRGAGGPRQLCPPA